MNVIGFIDYN